MIFAENCLYKKNDNYSALGIGNYTKHIDFVRHIPWLRNHSMDLVWQFQSLFTPTWSQIRPCHFRGEFAHLKKRRMITSPRAWLLTVTPKSDDTVILWKILHLSIFFGVTLNEMVAFHSERVQQKGFFRYWDTRK